MANGFGIELRGLQSIQVKIAGLRPRVEEILAEEIEASANAIELEAKQNAPNAVLTAHGTEKDEPGNIRTSLSSWSISKLTWAAGIARNAPSRVNDLAGYIEFGTGKYIDIPEGLEAYAMMWYKTGRGTILAQPYLFPAAERERAKLIERLKQDLKTL